MIQEKTYEELLADNKELRWQLEEANETLEAIRTGQVDALVVKNRAGAAAATDIEEQKREIETKDAFIGLASHELKTPLTSLKGYLQLILMHSRDELPDRVKQYVIKANIAVGKLQFLVDDLLDVSKIKAGRLSYNFDVINLKNIVA